MTPEQTQWLWLDTRDAVSLHELSDCCGVSEPELEELVDYCALVPLNAADPQVSFSAQWVIPLRAAAKLRLDFDLDLFTVAIVLGHLKRIEALERQVLSLQALLPPPLRSHTSTQ
jgi:chaperone modulatory protein CbpM